MALSYTWSILVNMIQGIRALLTNQGVRLTEPKTVLLWPHALWQIGFRYYHHNF